MSIVYITSAQLDQESRHMTQGVGPLLRFWDFLGSGHNISLAFIEGTLFRLVSSRDQRDNSHELVLQLKTTPSGPAVTHQRIG